VAAFGEAYGWARAHGAVDWVAWVRDSLDDLAERLAAAAAAGSGSPDDASAAAFVAASRARRRGGGDGA
jgi:hypothetical protein